VLSNRIFFVLLDGMRNRRLKGLPQTPAKQAPHPLPPLRSEAAVLDRREAFAALSTLPPPSAEVQRAFVAAKLKLLRTHPTIHPADREAAISRFRAILGTAVPLGQAGPVPGGVGYGTFYNDGFKTNFATGTAVSWEIICPNLPGGNVDTWLYLTATNRSSEGVEALVAYQGQQAFTFNIFDWARPADERWQPAVPYANLAPYLGSESTHGAQCQVIALINSTYQQTPGNWVNEVRLLDVQASQWHLVYQYGYQATLQDQTSSFVGSWAPIVETFQDVYSGTNLMGCLNTQILSRDSAGNWGQWTPLASTQSDLRTDNKGFALSFLDPNYNWAVHS
jgi:hypothetical protein